MVKTSSWFITVTTDLQLDLFNHRSVHRDKDEPYVLIYGEREFRVTECSKTENADSKCSVPHKHLVVQVKTKGTEKSNSATKGTVYKVLSEEVFRLKEEARIEQEPFILQYNQPVDNLRATVRYIHKDCCDSTSTTAGGKVKSDARAEKERISREQEQRIMEVVKSNPTATPLEVAHSLITEFGLKKVHALLPVIRTAITLHNEAESRTVYSTSGDSWANSIVETIARSSVKIKHVSDPAEAKCIALFLVTLFNCVKRDVGGDDAMPAIYVYGPSGSGKTSLFKAARRHIIATDAHGVSRYESNAPLFIFDDVPLSVLMADHNLSTLRALCTNDPTTTKTNGSTQRLSGKWLAITTNDARPTTAPEERRFCFIKTRPLLKAPEQQAPSQSDAQRALVRKCLEVLFDPAYVPSEWWRNLVRLRYLTDLCAIQDVVIPQASLFNQFYFYVQEAENRSPGEGGDIGGFTTPSGRQPLRDRQQRHGGEAEDASSS